MNIHDAVSSLAGVGAARQEQLEALGILTVRDLLYYAPFRYEEIDQVVSLKDLKADTKVTFPARVLSVTPIKSRRFRSMLKVKVGDVAGLDPTKIELTWFNTPYVLSALKVGQTYFFTGKVSEYQGKLTLTNPVFEQNRPDQGALVPIYHETAQITSRWLRKLMGVALEEVGERHLEEADDLAEVAATQDFVALSQALNWLHRPETRPNLKKATDRLAFDEMYRLVTQVMESKRQFRQTPTIAKFSVTNSDIEQFTQLLPYQPTSSQKEALQAVALDLAQQHPMHRLLQGEVGSGKTTIAAFALWVVAKAGYQVALVCPTKILAEQHAQSLAKLLGATGVGIGLVTAHTKDLDAQIVVGTHALFNRPQLKPALVVIDEEHRFGVEQRTHFFQKKRKPHLLSMTATPIPRTVALTALADYDVSFLEPHRAANTVKTWVVPAKKRSSAYKWISNTLRPQPAAEDEVRGQALVVCPFIDTSLVENLESVKSATAEYKKLQTKFPELNLKLLHGRMTEDDKSAIFKQMLQGKVDMLVTTPVVEVGVDLPAANVIVIEGADRFGLAQLHQLRGRVGRRGQQAFCLLFTSDGLEDEVGVSKRLDYFSNTYDGNALAEFDLKRRGSGELLGTRQHGFGELQFASWYDQDLIGLCKRLVEKQQH